MGNILLDGQIVNYEALGRGRPVIFLHSWVGSWRYWFPAMQVISKSFRAYALDMWEFGETASNPECYSIDQQTDLLNRFLEEMALGKVAIIGHGLGALVGFNFCVRWPQSVDRIMAISCPLSYDAINSRMRTSPRSDLLQWLGGKSKEAKMALADAAGVDPRAIETAIESFQSDNLFSKMCETQICCLLLYGQNDPAISVPAIEDSSGLSIMMHHVVFDKSGHFPMIDEATRFNHLLMDFLTLASGISPRELRL
jgi:pimeloyl-ACP methyl ester carboxylesterase